jgi:hypothetical protein
LPRGWEQIEAIEEMLKQEFILDSQAVTPDDASDPVEHFLKTKRGPAYLFATTAAMMVRSLGHESRLANGFYIDRDSFDVASGQHLIGKKQLHWWPQVSIDGSNWISIEPTPGYSSPPEQWTLFQRAQWAWNVAARWVRNHPWLLMGCMFGLAIAYRKRIFLVDCVLTTAVFFVGRLSIERRVAWSLWLMDKRAELAGCPRPPSKTQRQWFQRMQFRTIISDSRNSDSRSQPTASDSMRYVLNAQDELLYSPCRDGSSKKLIRFQDLETLQQSLLTLNKLWTVQAMRSANMPQQNDAPKLKRTHEYAPDYASIH